ncbi:MAG: VOC family protein [Lactobacillales bacterium]|jgi:hypothetical protein|nr:VOC family protein [Lactobacillales bacterium]
MFSDKLKIMLYVEDVDVSSKFWQAFGFEEISREEVDGTVVVEISSGKNSGTIFVLYDIAFIQENSPEVALNSPSIMFQSDNIEELYKNMLNQNVKVGDLIELPGGNLVFNFADLDENYYAVTSEK